MSTDWQSWPRNNGCICIGCGLPAFYGEMNSETGMMSWHCSSCWQIASELSSVLANEIKNEIDEEVLSTVIYQAAKNTIAVTKSSKVQVSDADLRELAKKAVEAQKNDKRTMEEKIADGVRFICDTRIGGD